MGYFTGAVNHDKNYRASLITVLSGVLSSIINPAGLAFGGLSLAQTSQAWIHEVTSLLIVGHNRSREIMEKVLEMPGCPVILELYAS